MVRINLASRENEKIKCLLDCPEYTVMEFTPCAGAELLRASAADEDTITLLELDTCGSGISGMEPGTLASLAASTCLVCCAPELTVQARSRLISAGISDCLCGVGPNTAAAYVRALSEGAAEDRGTFAVLDRDSTHLRIIRGIISRFGYRMRQTESIDDFYSYITMETPVMTLINLGAEVDFNSFIRRSHSSPIKKSPVIAYKDMGEGLFVHEVLNGLGRITKLILSPEELYRMLADMLLKKSIITGTHKLNHSLEFEKYGHYHDMTLQQVYYEIHPDPCGQKPFTAHNKSEKIMQELDCIRKLMVLGEGIKWLALKGGEEKPICGAGA